MTDKIISLAARKDTRSEADDCAEALKLAGEAGLTAVVIAGVLPDGTLYADWRGDLSQAYILCDQVKADILDAIEGD